MIFVASIGISLIFFFQAEDGIRDYKVTGVQTCALPISDIHEKGEVEVALAGRSFRIRREFLDDIAEQKLAACLANLRKALLVLHSPTDNQIGRASCRERV